MSLRRIAIYGLAIGALMTSFSAANARTKSYPVGDVNHVRAPQSVFTEPRFFDYSDRRLNAMKEPSLWQLSRDPNNRVFRFLWVPLEGKVLSIRIEFDNTGKANLTSSRSTGVTGEDWGEATDIKVTELTEQQIELFEFRLNKLDFWYLERELEGQEAEGDLWLLEGAEYGKYHAVPRYGQDIGLVYDFELFLVRFAGLDEAIITGADHNAATAQ
jgi:hypothetical protein